jgi:hypothetical protein
MFPQPALDASNGDIGAWPDLDFGTVMQKPIMSIALRLAALVAMHFEFAE